MKNKNGKNFWDEGRIQCGKFNDGERMNDGECDKHCRWRYEDKFRSKNEYVLGNEKDFGFIGVGAYFPESH
jgi:collagenase-like PrtC family protease